MYLLPSWFMVLYSLKVFRSQISTQRLLYALGVERAELEIAVISALFHPAYLETHPISCAKDNQELSDEDEELLFNRLRDLGYV